MAELKATIDMTEKTGDSLVAGTVTVPGPDGESHEYFMTNGYGNICKKLKSLQYWRPVSGDLLPNPDMDEALCGMMREKKALWSMMTGDRDGLLNYYDALTGTFFSASLRCISSVMDERKYPRAFVLAANDRGDELEMLLKEEGGIDERIDGGKTLLMIAALKDACSSASVLLRMGADVNATDRNGATALILAAQQNSTGVAKLLLSAPGIIPDAKDDVGDSALLYAAVYDDMDMCALLAGAGADLDITNDFGETPLIAAASATRIRTSGRAADFLIRSGANLESADSDGETALFHAAKLGKDGIVFALLKARADARHKDKLGITPLMAACYCGHHDAAAMLLAAGADVNAADDDGMTALMYAALKNDGPLMVFLTGYGADRTARSAEGKDATDYFREDDARTFFQMLEDKVKAHTPGADQAQEGNVPGTASVAAEPKSFGETFDLYLKKYFGRFPDRKNSDIYREAGLSKQRFSKILSNRGTDYRPRKENVIALALGLRLTLAESEDLLQSAGFILSPKDKADMLVKDFLAAGKHDIHELNGLIYEATGKTFFKSLTAGDEE